MTTLKMPVANKAKNFVVLDPTKHRLFCTRLFGSEIRGELGEIMIRRHLTSTFPQHKGGFLNCAIASNGARFIFPSGYEFGLHAFDSRGNCLGLFRATSAGIAATIAVMNQLSGEHCRQNLALLLELRAGINGGARIDKVVDAILARTQTR